MPDLSTEQIIKALKAYVANTRDPFYLFSTTIAKLEEHIRTIAALRDDRRKLKSGITRELGIAIERLGPDSDRGSLLAIVSSWGDTLTDPEVLEALKDYNSGGKNMEMEQ